MASVPPNAAYTGRTTIGSRKIPCSLNEFKPRSEWKRNGRQRMRTWTGAVHSEDPVAQEPTRRPGPESATKSDLKAQTTPRPSK